MRGKESLVYVCTLMAGRYTASSFAGSLGVAGSRGTDSDGGNSSGVKESLSSDDHAASGSSTLPSPLRDLHLKGYEKCKCCRLI